MHVHTDNLNIIGRVLYTLKAKNLPLNRINHGAPQLVMDDTIEKVSKSSILTKVSILSILAKSIGNSIPLEPAMFSVSIPDQSLDTS